MGTKPKKRRKTSSTSGGKLPAVLGHAPLGKGLRHAAEGGIRLFVERIAHEQVSGDAEDQEREGKKTGEPEGEPGPDGTDTHLLHLHHVADAAHRMDQFRIRVRIDLFPQVIDVDIDTFVPVSKS